MVDTYEGITLWLYQKSLFSWCIKALTADNLVLYNYALATDALARKLNDKFQKAPVDKLKEVMEFCEKQKGGSYKIPDAVFEVTSSSAGVQYFVLEAKTNVNPVLRPSNIIQT